MWQEPSLFGVLLPPILLYGIVAFILYLPIRFALARFRIYRWMYNPPLAETAIYVVILGLLIGLV